MAVINSDAEVIVDHWSYPGTDVGTAGPGPRVVPCEVLGELRSEGSLDRPSGVYVAAGMRADQIAPFLAHLELIVVEFQKFRDGRGFTVARTLREKHDFKGDIRAIGHILPDQLTALKMCGFSSIVTPLEHPPSQWRDSVDTPSATEKKGPLLQRLLGQATGP